MQESYGEGLATHAGPESCASTREGGGEALTGVRAGRTSSREMGMKFEGAHAVRRAEGNTGRAVMARTAPTPRGLRTRACTEALHTACRRSHARPGRDGDPVRAVNPRGVLRR